MTEETVNVMTRSANSGNRIRNNLRLRKEHSNDFRAVRNARLQTKQNTNKNSFKFEVAQERGDSHEFRSFLG